MTALPHPVPTPLERSGMRRALALGFANAFLCDPSPQALAMGLAQCCLEHANGHALWGWDFGNIAATPDWTGDTALLRQREILHGAEVHIDKPMRVYESAPKGAEGYWRLLSEPQFAFNGKHASVYFDAGDPVGASAALKAGGWFTATLASYTAEMVQLYAECLRVT